MAAEGPLLILSVTKAVSLVGWEVLTEVEDCQFLKNSLMFQRDRSAFTPVFPRVPLNLSVEWCQCENVATVVPSKKRVPGRSV